MRLCRTNTSTPIPKTWSIWRTMVKPTGKQTNITYYILYCIQYMLNVTLSYVLNYVYVILTRIQIIQNK